MVWGPCIPLIPYKRMSWEVPILLLYEWFLTYAVNVSYHLISLLIINNHQLQCSTPTMTPTVTPRDHTLPLAKLGVAKLGVTY